MIRTDFLAMSRSATALLRDPAVGTAWGEPSALPEFSVAGLAGHLAFQILSVPRLLAGPVPAEPTIDLVDHYRRAMWIDAGLDADINVNIRKGGEEVAAKGPAALAAQVESVVEELAGSFAEVANRPVRIQFWGPWSLLFDDFLLTRMMEIAVHADDLAVSVGIETPELPQRAVESVVDLLTRLSLRRHGQANVLRALSRRERQPATITAF